MKNEKKIAIFFDCENVSAKYLDEIFLELAKVGEVMIRLAYNDWSNKRSFTWGSKLPMFAIKPIHTNTNTASKNVSDFQIVIDVMNTMHSSSIDTIVLVSSDSDFTSLAIEIKSKGFEVIGFGESKTPASLKNAYSTFYELPMNKKVIKTKKTKKIKDVDVDVDVDVDLDENEEVELDIITILEDAVRSTKGEDDYSYISQIGIFLKNKNASLHPRNYGANTWSEILRENSDVFEVSYKDNKRSQIVVKLVEHIDY